MKKKKHCTYYVQRTYAVCQNYVIRKTGLLHELQFMLVVKEEIFTWKRINTRAPMNYAAVGAKRKQVIFSSFSFSIS